MKSRKLLLIFSIMMVFLLLTGCRVRVISDANLADSVITPPQEDVQEPEEPEQEDEAEEPPVEQDDTEPEENTEEETDDVQEATTPEQSDTVSESRPGAATTIAQTATAEFKEQTASDITVTYDPNGGDSGTFSTVVHAGETYGTQPTATRRGYAFNGWWTMAEGGEAVTGDTIVTSSENHTLYAHWQDKRTCTVTFDGNGGRVKTAQAHIEIGDGDLYSTMPTPLREGYNFDGWWTTADGGDEITSGSVFTGVDDVTIYAHWSYDPYAFWTFTLQNKTQQVYMCQQVSIYFETEENNVTKQNCSLITSTGSLNIAENREDTNVTDDWVNAKKPQLIIKCVSGMSSASSVKSEMAARFPDSEIVIVSTSALSDSSGDGIYARLALAKHLYGDWYTDVDMSVVAQELGVSDTVIYF